MSMISEDLRKLEVREAILSAALQLIHEKGVARLSLREIARRVKYSPAGLYEYFDGKTAIIQAVRLRALTRFYEVLSGAVEDEPYPGRILALGNAYIHFASYFPQEFLLLFTHLRGEIEETEAEAAMSQKCYAFLASAVQSGIDEGSIGAPPNLEAPEAAFAFWSMVHGAAMLQVSYRRDLTVDVSKAVEMAIRALATGLSAT